MPVGVRGQVSSFDDPRGYGVITTEDGRVLFFHCTAIAAGSRSIEPGVTVAFDIAAGHLGRWEAVAIRAA